jgi:hypothetical protein
VAPEAWTSAIGPQLQRMQPDHHYVALHTHRVGSSFSPDDALVLVMNSPIRMIAVVAMDGTWYLLSKLRHQTAPSGAEVLGRFRAAAAALSSRYLASVHAGTVSREDALRAFSHAIWQQIAPDLGLRYDRVDRL